MTLPLEINGRFKPIRIIGRGSFGEVWLCEDMVLGINVAIKFYVTLDARGLEDFKNEFKNVSHLNHPNLLRPDYYDQFENSPYLVMAYCPITIGDKVGHFSEQEAWRLIRDISAGLAYLHTNDIVHRDIKPDNILQTEQGVFVISDFGLSQRMRSTLRRASSRQNNNNSDLSGTVGYMAPELFTAKPLAVKATDVWAMGATIYESLTGDMPFCGQGGTMQLHGAEIPELPSQYGRTLENLIQRCLARDPWDRPTATEINRIARSVLGEDETAPHSAHPSKREEQLKKEIDKLKSELKKTKAEVGKPQKSKGFKTAFWITLVTLIVSLLFLSCVIYLVVDDYEASLAYRGDVIEEAEQIILNVKEVCDHGATTPDETFSYWKSTNHGDRTTDQHYYNIQGFEDDIFSLDYNVDSEPSYDKFFVKVIHEGDTLNLKSVSGLKKSGHVSYTLPSTGDFTFVVQYVKDASWSKGKDYASVGNVRLHHSTIGEISRIIKNYNPIDSVAFLYRDLPAE